MFLSFCSSLHYRCVSREVLVSVSESGFPETVGTFLAVGNFFVGIFLVIGDQ